MIRPVRAFFVTDANGRKAELKDAALTLKTGAFKLILSEDWKQMMLDAWRLERDYFYD